MSMRQALLTDLPPPGRHLGVALAIRAMVPHSSEALVQAWRWLQRVVAERGFRLSRWLVFAIVLYLLTHYLNTVLWMGEFQGLEGYFNFNTGNVLQQGVPIRFDHMWYLAPLHHVAGILVVIVILAVGLIWRDPMTIRMGFLLYLVYYQAVMWWEVGSLEHPSAAALADRPGLGLQWRHGLRLMAWRFIMILLYWVIIELYCYLCVALR
jgi:hypothetical protein